MFSLSYAWSAPPHDTGHGVKTLTLGWVVAQTERTPFRIHDAVLNFVDRCLSRTRSLAASNQKSAWVFLKTMLAQHLPQICLFRAFSKLRNYFFFYVAHRKRVLFFFCCYFWNSNLLLKLRCTIGIGLSRQYGFFLSSSLLLSSLTITRFYPQRGSGQAVVTGLYPSPPRYAPSFFIAHRIQHSHCSSIFTECS